MHECDLNGFWRIFKVTWGCWTVGIVNETVGKVGAFYLKVVDFSGVSTNFT